MRSKELSNGNGVSSWLSVLPISDHGFALHKGAFHDALQLATIKPTKPLCQRQFFHHRSCTQDHLPDRWFSICAANLLTEVCPDVCIDPSFNWRTAVDETSNSEDAVRLDVSTQGFGVIVTNWHFLMYVFYAQMLKKCSYHQHTTFMNTRSRGLMTNVYRR